MSDMDNLLKSRGTDVPLRVRLEKACRCECGEDVAQGRTFVNQAHYNVWLSRVRYVGKNARLR